MVVDLVAKHVELVEAGDARRAPRTDEQERIQRLSGADPLADDDCRSDEHRADARRGRRIVEPVERGPHREHAEAADGASG